MLRARWLGRVPYGEADRLQRALHERRVLRVLLGKDLDRDRAVQNRVLAAIDLCHPALAEERLNPVATTEHPGVRGHQRFPFLKSIPPGPFMR